MTTSSDDTVTFISPAVPHMLFKLEMEDGHVENVQFTEGRVHVSKKVGEALEALFARRPKLGRGITKVDREAAEKLALEHKKQAAIKGGLTSTNGFTQSNSQPNMAQEMQQKGFRS